MPNKEFLEDFSLFRKLKAEIPSTLDGLRRWRGFAIRARAIDLKDYICITAKR